MTDRQKLARLTRLAEALDGALGIFEPEAHAKLVSPLLVDLTLRMAELCERIDNAQVVTPTHRPN